MELLDLIDLYEDGEFSVEYFENNYESQYELGYYVHADFAVHHKGKLFIIEYDGRQHYHPVKHFGGYGASIRQRLKDYLEDAECKD